MRAHARPARGHGPVPPRPIDAVRLERTSGSGTRVALRPPRVADWAAWRDVRLRDEERIAPFWAHVAGESWSSRHSRERWIRTLLHQRRLARLGRAVTFVIEVDGVLAGELWLSGMDAGRTGAELGMWVDARLQGTGATRSAGVLTEALAVDVLGLSRLSAPVAVDNVSASTVLAGFGFTCEAVLEAYPAVGDSVLKDHLLWTKSYDASPSPGPGPGAVEVTATSWQSIPRAAADAGAAWIVLRWVAGAPARRVVWARRRRRDG